MDDDKLKAQHFRFLIEKYDATNDTETSPNSLLYLILRKVDLRMDISEQEQQWLQNHNLTKTLEWIQLLQYQSQEEQRLEAEFTQLKHQYKIPAPCKLSSSSPLYTILWQLEYEHRVTQADVQWLQEHQLEEQAHWAATLTEFTVLKQHYGASQYKLWQPDTDLYPILKKIHAEVPLSEVEAEWLLDAGLLDTFEIFEKQEEKRKLNAEFSGLKSKYGLENHPETSTYSFLFSILRRIDGGQSLSTGEISWLKDENLLALIKIDQNLKNRQTFEYLKVKYRVQGSEHSAFSEKLFHLLQAIDTKTYLSDRDVQWLEDQELVETAVFAHVTRFLTLKKKYRLVDPNLPFQPFYDMMVKIERGERLDRKHIAQLIHEEQLWWDGLIVKASHRLEAQFYVQELQRTGNKWNIPSAVSDWRKADELEKALQLSEHLKLGQIADHKLKAAILTTRGQTLRDMSRLEEAKTCAQESVDLQPDDHRPYMLMATILDRQYQSYAAHEWWEKAIARGADPNDRDYEMKRLVKNTKEPQKREEVVRYLLQQDPKRYAWARDYLRGCLKS